MAHAPNSPAARDIAYLIHPYTNLALHEEKGPLVLTRGENIYVWDEDDNRYIEGLAGLWCTSLGFSEQRLVDAATRQLEALPYSHVFAHRSCPPVIDLAEKLMRMAPKPLAKVFFTCSGSEAVDSAIKMVWYYNNALDRPDKKKIIARKNAYHGITIAGGSLTGLPVTHKGFDLPIPGMLHTDTPHFYRFGKEGESEEDYATRCAESLDALIREQGPETVAAFIAEPVLGAGGVIPPPRTYFEKVQKVLRKHDVLMIADEVICGFARTGNMWGCQTYGIVPDMVTCAKQLSSAYAPIAAVMVTEPVFRAIADYSAKMGAFGTGFTYGGHPVSAAVALETLRIYEERDIVAHVRRVTPRFQERLASLNDHPLVGEARGVGLIGGVKLAVDKPSRTPFPVAVKAAQVVAAKALERGLIVRALPCDAIGICPPLIIEEGQIDEMFDIIEAALEASSTVLRDAA